MRSRGSKQHANLPPRYLPPVTVGFGSVDLPIAETANWPPFDGGSGAGRRRFQPGRNPFQALHLGLLGHFQSVIDLDAQGPHGTCQLSVA